MTRPGPAARPPSPPRLVTLSIVGTNDLHGALDRLPLFGGYLANLRAARMADGGAVVLVDAGDMFQGTLESNLGEGADVVRAYNQLGYAATTLGNHEFDYGPAGPAATAQHPGDDPRGALEARATEAMFPFLVSNIDDAAKHARINYRNMPASTLVTAAGFKVGIIGAATASTPYTTMPANFVGLTVAPVIARIQAAAADLRAHGADLIVVTGHLGGKCTDLTHPDDASSCLPDEEIMPVLAALPPNTVDVFVAGHTHAGMAHAINGVAVIESFSQGRAFGRVDVQFTAGVRTATIIHPPQLICPLDARNNPIPVADCHPEPYEGSAVVADRAVQVIADAALAKAGERRGEKIGVTLAGAITRAHAEESDEGNWFCDLMLAVRPDADVALTNGGALRTGIPAGELTYGRFFEAMPFDNRFALVDVQGKDLRDLVTTNLQRDGSILSWSGLAATAKCGGAGLEVKITVRGKPLVDAKHYRLVTSDFLASGGDGLIGRLHLPAGSITYGDVIIRESVADLLRARKGTIDPTTLMKPRRLQYAGVRPLTCGGPGARKRGPAEPE